MFATAVLADMKSPEPAPSAKSPATLPEHEGQHHHQAPSPAFGVATSIIADVIGVEGSPTLLILTALIAAVLFVCDFIGALLRHRHRRLIRHYLIIRDNLKQLVWSKATATAAFYATGVSHDSLPSMALRFPAQIRLVHFASMPDPKIETLPIYLVWSKAHRPPRRQPTPPVTSPPRYPAST